MTEADDSAAPERLVMRFMSEAELERMLSFHVNDRGTMTIEQELRRLYIIQEATAELIGRKKPTKEST